jgi:hypothetical protein
MPQFGGKDSKRHFTVVMGGKEHGLYVSSTPSSAARKAVTKLCTANKSKKVEFSIREITQGSKKKTYGPYEGHIEKLKEPIELKGRVIKYKPVAKLSGKKGVMKGVMKGGNGIDEFRRKMDYFKRESGTQYANKTKLLKQASELTDECFMLAGSTQDPYILKELLDNFYFIYIVFNVKKAYNVFQIIKAKYDSMRSRNPNINRPDFPKIYPPMKE